LPRNAFSFSSLIAMTDLSSRSLRAVRLRRSAALRPC
jgi:hypothetical protein